MKNKNTTDAQWVKLIDFYTVPTYLKKFITEPFLLRKKFLEPILDAGCGTGHVLKILTDKGLFVMGVDINLNKKKVQYRAIRADIEKFKPKDFLVGDVLLINVFSCIDSAAKRQNILNNLKKIKSPKGKIYVIHMAEDILGDDFKSSVMSVSQKQSKKAYLKFKQIDGKEIGMMDNMIFEQEFEEQCKKAGLKILKKIYKKYKKEKFNIYTIYILR
ncbi:MAG: methyltransferase domain-containing protein [Patescibacteria group bacterium]